jgi:mitochondrial chaperone BCS1
VLVPLGGTIDDNALLNMINSSPRDSIVLLEDVDCALAVPREDTSTTTSTVRPAIQSRGLRDSLKEPPSGVSLSGLLNAIDGVAAQEGRLVFMTTNYRERLDEALIRPGRVDCQFYLQKASNAAAGELFDQFFVPEEHPLEEEKHRLQLARSAFLQEVLDDMHSFAQLQGALMKARDDPSKAADEMRKCILSVNNNNNNDDIPLEPNNNIANIKLDKESSAKDDDGAIDANLNKNENDNTNNDNKEKEDN